MTGIGTIRLNHVGIMVVDIDAVIEWYTQNLGMQVRDRWENDEAGMKWAHLVAGDVVVEFVQRPDLDVSASGAAGYHHLAITVEDAEAATRLLETAGGVVEFAPSYFERHDMHWAFVKDPFGNIIEIISYRSRE